MNRYHSYQLAGFSESWVLAFTYITSHHDILQAGKFENIATKEKSVLVHLFIHNMKTQA